MEANRRGYAYAIVSFICVIILTVSVQAEESQFVRQLLATKDCRGCDLRNADLNHASLQDADLRGADLRGADLRGTDLTDTNLQNAILKGADLSGANLIDANLHNADLSGANLTNANLRNANLTDANLSDANGFAKNMTVRRNMRKRVRGRVPSAAFQTMNVTDYNDPGIASSNGICIISSADKFLTPPTKRISPQTLLTPLTPHRIRNRKIMPLTVRSHPEFFWYIPKNWAEKIEFFLVDENHNRIYRTEFIAPETAGIMSVSLPKEDEYTLEEGKRYYWLVVLICGDDATGYPYVEAWIERLDGDSPLARQVANSENPFDYARAGIWQEALAYFARDRRNHPDDREIALNWQEFLESVDLGRFANAPFLEAIPSDPAMPGDEKRHRYSKPVAKIIN
ncbi:MAG: DUF928 domain-containing protein [Spirulina sp.]